MTGSDLADLKRRARLAIEGELIYAPGVNEYEPHLGENPAFQNLMDLYNQTSAIDKKFTEGPVLKHHHVWDLEILAARLFLGKIDEAECDTIVERSHPDVENADRVISELRKSKSRFGYLQDEGREKDPFCDNLFEPLF